MHCAGFTKDGKQCGARAQKGKAFCLFHDPERREDFIEASRKGGKGKTLIQAEVVEVMKALPAAPDPLSISDFLGDLTQRVLRGEIHPSVANSCAYLAAQRINALKTASQIQKRNTEGANIILQQADDEERYQLVWDFEDDDDSETAS